MDSLHHVPAKYRVRNCGDWSGRDAPIDELYQPVASSEGDDIREHGKGVARRAESKCQL